MVAFGASVTHRSILKSMSTLFGNSWPRGAVRDATDSKERIAARLKVDAAKQALGERDEVWWDDGAPDYNRRLAALLGDANPARAKRAFESMMQMKRIDIAALERAADGLV
jgi:hypothetical protein